MCIGSVSHMLNSDEGTVGRAVGYVSQELNGGEGIVGCVSFL